MRGLITALLLSSSLIASPALAQSKKELAAQNAALSQRVTTLESRLLTGDPAAERLMQRIDALEGAQRSLTGEVERLRYERDNLRAEVAALEGDIRATQDLNNRIKMHLDAVDLVTEEQNAARQRAVDPRAPRVYSGGPTELSSVPAAPTTREVTIPVQEQYTDMAQLPETGKTKLAEGDFSGAQTAFKQYLDFNPDAPDAGEISYWLGEAYYVKGGYADAADAYISSMRKAPKGAKAPDAMVRLAAAMRELGNKDQACQTLDSFPAQYPNAPASVREKARVESARTGC